MTKPETERTTLVRSRRSRSKEGRMYLNSEETEYTTNLEEPVMEPDRASTSRSPRRSRSRSKEGRLYLGTEDDDKQEESEIAKPNPLTRSRRSRSKEGQMYLLSGEGEEIDIAKPTLLTKTRRTRSAAEDRRSGSRGIEEDDTTCEPEKSPRSQRKTRSRSFKRTSKIEKQMIQLVQSKIAEDAAAAARASGHNAPDNNTPPESPDGTTKSVQSRARSPRRPSKSFKKLASKLDKHLILLAERDIISEKAMEEVAENPSPPDSPSNRSGRSRSPRRGSRSFKKLVSKLDKQLIHMADRDIKSEDAALENSNANLSEGPESSETTTTSQRSRSPRRASRAINMKRAQSKLDKHILQLEQQTEVITESTEEKSNNESAGNQQDGVCSGDDSRGPMEKSRLFRRTSRKVVEDSPKSTLQIEKTTPSSSTATTATTGKDEVFWESAYQELQAELTALRAHTKSVEDDLAQHKQYYKEEKEAREALTEEWIDMEHDLAETKRVRQRLERENDRLRERLVKREAENSALQAKLDELTGTTPKEEEWDEEELDEDMAGKSKSRFWGFLAAEEVQEGSANNSGGNTSGGGLLDTLFNQSTLLDASGNPPPAPGGENGRGPMRMSLIGLREESKSPIRRRKSHDGLPLNM